MKEFPPFRLDTVNERLWRRRDTGDEVHIHLTPKAFAMLKYLVEHAGRLVTQNELLEALWPETFVQPQVLKSHILDIRSAMGDTAKNPRFIETLPRRGYQFIALVRDGVAKMDLVVEPPAPNLIGRNADLGRLGEILQTTLHGRRQIVFVTGEPGIGKTALVDEFQRQAAAKYPDILVARGQCVEGYGGKEAYYSMLETLGQLCHGPGGDSVVQILAAQAPTWLVQFPALVKREQREVLQREILGATRERMLREISEALETISSERPLLLAFADLHWMDPSSVDLISALARRRQSAKLMLIGTYRPVDIALSDHPLKTLKQDLLIHHLCHEIPLQPLKEAEVAEYLAAESGGSAVPEGLAELIHRHSEGNPLFMVAALSHMCQRGLISNETGSWRLNVPLIEMDLEVPETLRQMIETLIDRLSIIEQQVLEVASLESFGRSGFAITPSAALTGLELEIFEDACETLSRWRGILRPAGVETFIDGTVSTCYEFVHVLYREVCYRRIAPGRRAKLHRQIGAWAETRLELNETAVWLAEHFERGGDWLRAIKYLQLAADTAKQRLEPRRAADILEHGLKLVKKLPVPEKTIVEIEIVRKLANTYFVFGIQFKTWPNLDDRRTIEVHEALAVRASQCGLIDVEVGALLGLAFSAGWVSSDRCLMALELALQLSDKQRDPLARARTRMTCFSWRLFVAGWNSKDVDQCRNALAAIRDSGDELALAIHLIDYAVILFHLSQYREGLRSVRESVKIFAAAAEKDPLLVSLPLGYLPLGVQSIFLGEWGEALLNLKAGIAFWDKNANYSYARALRLHVAWLHLFAQDFAGARAICESALPLIRLPDQRLEPASRIYGHEFQMCLILTASADTALGNYERALEYLMTARDKMDRETVAIDWYFRILLEFAFTDLCLVKEDLTQARAHAERSLDLVLAAAEHTYQALAWEANARVARAETDFKRAKECIANALSAMEGFEVPLAAWRVHATAAEIYEDSGAQDLAEQHRTLSCVTIKLLVNSLPKEESLREVFLSGPIIREIFNENDIPQLRAEHA